MLYRAIHFARRLLMYSAELRVLASTTLFSHGMRCSVVVGGDQRTGEVSRFLILPLPLHRHIVGATVVGNYPLAREWFC